MDNSFLTLIHEIKDGMTFTLSKSDCVDGDNFLIFNDSRREQTITIHKNRAPFWLGFDRDEPILLEECPDTFFKTLLLNIEKGNYTINE